MGPAYLLDIMGMDTADDGAAVRAEGLPARMKLDFTSATQVLFNDNRLGQKNTQASIALNIAMSGTIGKAG